MRTSHSLETQFFPFKRIGVTKPIRITYEQISASMNKITNTQTNKKTGHEYAVMNPETGETYSPKQVLGSIIGKKFNFYGGKGFDGANRVFQVFGFPVGRQNELEQKRAELVLERRSADSKVPTVENLLDQMFSQNWLPFSQDKIQKLRDGQCPGVYVLAYSEKNLVGKPVRETDVFYAGMTCEGGLSARLEQFRLGTLGRIAHSGATRFFRFWLKRKRYRPNSSPRLYLAYVPIKCETVKGWRNADDICNLSRVVELELATIARVKRAIGHEPLLNKK